MKNRLYIVEFNDDPVICFEGNSNFESTKVVRNTLEFGVSQGKLDKNCEKVKKYRSYLEKTHETLRENCCGLRKLCDYFYGFNGIACCLDSEEIYKSVETHCLVKKIHENSSVQLQTSNLVEYLGLDGVYRCDDCSQNKDKKNQQKAKQSKKFQKCFKSLWDQLGGVERAGENIIIGILDDGINPDHLCFSDRVDPKTKQPVSRNDPRGVLAYTPPPSSWNGICQVGEGWSVSDCSNKIIGARYYTTGFNGIEGLKRLYGDFMLASARATEGHGPACAGIAAGNANTPTDDGDIISTVSGVAPRARIAVYRCFYDRNSTEIDVVGAIDDAISDGVDVISASFGSGVFTGNTLTPITISFFNAALSGICVIQATGNDPDIGSTVSFAPFITSVGATGIYRIIEAQFVSGSKNKLYFTTPTRYNFSFKKREIVFAEDIKAKDASYLSAISLIPGSIDKRQAYGKVIVCNSTNISVSVKARTAYELGCKGLIVNTESFDDLYNPLFGLRITSKIPVILLTGTEVDALRKQLEKESCSATLRGSTKTKKIQLCLNSTPVLADFSSKGPIQMFSQPFTAPDLLKIDVCAPGVDLYTASTPSAYGTGVRGSNFQFFTGTSASCPVVAGVAALLQQKYPDWSPGTVKSAIMTTATDLFGQSPLDKDVSFGQGSGFVNPNRGSDPGLVFEVGGPEWFGYYCESNQINPEICAQLATMGVPTTTRNYNHPAIFLNSFIPNKDQVKIARVGQETIVRQVTNIYHKTCSYTAFIETDQGVHVSVEPSKFTIEPGKKQLLRISIAPSLEFKAARSRFPTENILNDRAIYNNALITWQDEFRHKVKFPLVVGFTDLIVPVSVWLPPEGNVTVPVIISKSLQVFNVRFQGLFPSQILEGQLFGFNFGAWFVPDGATQSFDLTIDDDTNTFIVKYFPEESSNPNALLQYTIVDTTMKVIKEGLLNFEDLVLSRTLKNLKYNNPYRLFINCFLNNQPIINYKVHVWQIKDQDTGNMRFLPQIPTNEILSDFPLALQVEALNPTKKYYGQIIYPVSKSSSEKTFESTFISNF